MIRVLFFGPMAAQVDEREMQLEFQVGLCLQDIVAQLQLRYPKAFELVCFTAVNEVQTHDMRLKLADHDEIAFMAKFSGG
jgi:molybdopterin converting factor small subunit